MDTLKLKYKVERLTPWDMMWWSLTVSAVCDKGREGLYGFRISTCRNFRSGYTSSIRITITHLNEVCYQSIFKFVNFYFSFSGGGILVNLVFFNWFLFFIVCLGVFFQTLTESFQLFYCNYIEKKTKNTRWHTMTFLKWLGHLVATRRKSTCCRPSL